jgi:rhodanese-related sulfurtransferase
MSKKQKAGRTGRRGQHGRQAGGLRISWLPVAVFAVVLVAAAAFLLLRSQPAPAGVAEITPAQAYGKLQAGAFFVDVRTAAEYADAHIAGSVLIPLDELANRLNEVPRDQDVVLICRSGARSREGAAILQQAGFTRLSCLGGGLLAWTGAGYPVEQGQ